jgi:hypothetical protein
MFTFQVGVQTQSVFAQGSQMLTAGNAGHIFSGKGKKGGDTASHTTCAGYKVFHIIVLHFVAMYYFT